MADDSTPVATPAVAPGSTPAPAATTTTPTPLAGDEEIPISLAEARKLRHEAQELRKRIKAYDDAQAAAELAKLGETERLNKQYADLQEQHELLVVELAEARVVQDVSKYAAKLNFVLSPDLLSRLILADFDAIKFEDGKPTNVEQLLEKLAKGSPDLVRAEQPAQPTPAQSRPPALPAMNQRATIPPPGGQTGKPPRLSDPGIWKK